MPSHTVYLHTVACNTGVPYMGTLLAALLCLVDQSKEVCTVMYINCECL